MNKLFVKLIVLFVIVFTHINLSFALYEVPENQIKQFKKDATETIQYVLYDSNAIDNKSNVKFVEDLLESSKQFYNAFLLNKNNSEQNKEFIQLITDNSDQINRVDAYTPLAELLKKYDLDIAEDSNSYDYIYNNYLKKYKIPKSTTYINFVHGMYDKQMQMLDMRDEIYKYTYSELHETDTNNYETSNEYKIDNTHIPAAQLEGYTNESNDSLVQPPNEDSNEGMSMIVIIGTIAFLIYFLPGIVASLNGHKNTTAVCVLNLFLGWTLLGWVVALVWACCNTDKKEKIIIQEKTEEKQISFTEELEKLADLKERGIITEEEFNAKKAQILDL